MSNYPDGEAYDRLIQKEKSELMMQRNIEYATQFVLEEIACNPKYFVREWYEQSAEYQDEEVSADQLAAIAFYARTCMDNSHDVALMGKRYQPATEAWIEYEAERMEA